MLCCTDRARLSQEKTLGRARTGGLNVSLSKSHALHDSSNEIILVWDRATFSI